jgi:hypothetical protein
MKTKIYLMFFIWTIFFGLSETFHVNAQTTDDITTLIPIKDSTIYYEDVVQVDSNIKSIDLYNKGREWFVETYFDAKSVLQLDDAAGGKMMGKGVYKYSFVNGINVSEITMRFILNLETKDGRYRYRIYSFYGDNTNTSMLGGENATNVSNVDYNKTYYDLKAGNRKKYNAKMLKGMNEQVQSIITSLNKAMLAKKSSW